MDNTPSANTPCHLCGQPGFRKWRGLDPYCPLHYEVARIMGGGGDSINLVQACNDTAVLAEVQRVDRRKTIREAAARRLAKLVLA